MNKTKIERTNFTANPLKYRTADGKVVWGCVHASEGCRHCYSEALAHRYGRGGPFTAATMAGLTPFMDEKELRSMLTYKPAAGKMCFVGDMTDIFGEWVPFELLDKLFAVFALRPDVIWQILTKHPERMREYTADPQAPFRVARAIDVIEVDTAINGTPYEMRPIPGLDKYFADNSGAIWTTHGSGQCVWCGEGFNAGQQDSIYCGQKCRQAAAYSRKMNRHTEPSGRTMRHVNFEVGEQGHRRFRIVGGARELVHRAILRTFDREPLDGEQGCHKDGNPGRNHICNLRWGTQSNNWDDRARHGNGRVYAKLTERQASEIKKRILAGEAAESLGPKFGISGTQARNIGKGEQWATSTPIAWPLANCWHGVSVEDQKTADARIPLLLQTPAAIRFVSYEPALEAVNFWPTLEPSMIHGVDVPGLDLVIVGGESGPKARYFDVQWANSVVEQCRNSQTAVFVKQVGSNVGYQGAPVRIRLKDRKGGDMSEWPEDLRVRELPGARV